MTPRKYKPIFCVRCNAAEVFLVLREQRASVGRVIAVPGVSHLPLQTTKIESQNQVFNYNRIELFSFISEITLYENDSNKKVKLFWGATSHESSTKDYSKTVHVLAVRTQFVQWEHKLNAIHSKLNESIQHEAGKLFGVFPPIAWSAGMRLLRDKRPQ